MKKLIIGGLAGSVILFIWQFVSWAALDLHGSQMDYTPQQDSILERLISLNLEQGDYFVPRAPRGASQEEAQTIMENAEGKPWAIVRYRESMTNAMGMSLFRGWALSLVAALLLSWLLGQFASLDILKAALAGVSIGVIGYLTIPYLNSVWFEGNTFPDLVDAIVPWAITGAFLGWWIPRN